MGGGGGGGGGSAGRMWKGNVTDFFMFRKAKRQLGRIGRISASGRRNGQDLLEKSAKKDLKCGEKPVY